MFKKILVSFSIYTLTSVICALLGLLILPVLTKHLSEKDYGLTALFSTYIAILSPILGLTSGGYFWLNFFKERESKNYLAEIFSTYFWLACGAGLLILVFLGCFFPLFEQISVFSFFFVLLIPAASFISLIGDESKNYFINNKKPAYYLIYSVFFTLLELGLSYYFILFVFKNWQGRIFAWIISLLLQFLFTVWLFGIKEKYIKFTFNKSLLIKLIVFGYPLIFHQLGKFVINQSDRLFITRMISIEEAGIYSIGYQVGAMMLLPIAAFTNLYAPFVYERLADITPFKKVEIAKASYFFMSAVILCFLGVVLIAPYFFELLIDKKFHGGLIYVFWVALGYVFWAGYMQFSAVVFLKEKTKFLGFLSVFNVLLNAVLNYFLIKQFGTIGAAYATTISFFCVFIIMAVYSHILAPMPWLLKTKNEP